jgi:hypothetical protein
MGWWRGDIVRWHAISDLDGEDLLQSAVYDMVAYWVVCVIAQVVGF